ncbi:hypothetical protein ACOSP7_029288 [Xanthoceras sorbifolium]
MRRWGRISAGGSWGGRASLTTGDASPLANGAVPLLSPFPFGEQESSRCDRKGRPFCLPPSPNGKGPSMDLSPWMETVRFDVNFF